MQISNKKGGCETQQVRKNKKRFYLDRYHDFVVLYFLLAVGGHKMSRELSKLL